MLPTDIYNYNDSFAANTNNTSTTQMTQPYEPASNNNLIDENMLLVMPEYTIDNGDLNDLHIMQMVNQVLDENLKN